jgi:hypothetical protein
MKSALNKNLVYINCKEIEVDGTDCKAIIRVANCDDGYRAVCNYKFKDCLHQMPVTQFVEPVTTEREAIASAIEERLKSIIDRSGVKENKEIVYLLHKLLQEYNQLDLFEDENN